MIYQDIKEPIAITAMIGEGGGMEAGENDMGVGMSSYGLRCTPLSADNVAAGNHGVLSSPVRL